MFDISSWLEPHLDRISGHSKPHVFRIAKEADGNVTLKWKMWSTDKVMHTGVYGNYTYRQRGTKMVFKVMGSKVKVMSEKYISEGI